MKIRSVLSLIILGFLLNACDNKSVSTVSDTAKTSLNNNKLEGNIDKISDESVIAKSSKYQFLDYANKPNPAIFLVGTIPGAYSSHSLGFIKLCYETVFKNKGNFVSQRFYKLIHPGEVAVIEQRTDLGRGDVFLCQIGYEDHNKVKVPVHKSTRMIEVDGAGIYYLGTLRTQDVNETRQKLYEPEIPGDLKSELVVTINKIREKYGKIHLPIKNFDLDKLASEESVPIKHLGNIVLQKLQRKQQEMIEKSQIKQSGPVVTNPTK